MKAEIISIGDELLLGQTINTNAGWMGQKLFEAGVEVQQVTTITDSREHILQALQNALSRAEVVLLTGGLGPTRDDITKETLCEFFDTKLVMNTEVRDKIRAYFESRNLPILPVNEQQAELPEMADVLINRRGTAMGMWFERDGKVVVSMPGVPHEMEGMMVEEVLPRLEKLFGNSGSYYQVVQTIGKGESFIARKIMDWEDKIRSEGLGLAYLPSTGMVRLRVSGPKSMKDQIDKESRNLVEILGDIVFAEGDITLSEVIADLLRASGKTLSLAESCTGGYLAHLITANPGSSEYFIGGAVTYSNAMKSELLGVSEESINTEGAVSESVARQMAEGMRKRSGSDFSLAITGIAGPDGGTREKPVGTVWIAISSAEGTRAVQNRFGRNRHRNIRVSALYAMDMLRRHLEGQNLE